MSGGFYKRRRGILDHLRDGRLTLLELGAHDVILLLADKASGIWVGSAKALAANCGAGDISDRQARHLLESLERKEYIRRFPRRRSHANYPILVNRYMVTFGAYNGMTLNASATVDWRRPVYELRLEQGAEDGVEHAPIQEVRKKKEEKATAPVPRAVVPTLTDWIPKDAWVAYLKLRKEKRAKVTPEAVDLLIRKLDAWRHEGQDVREILERSVMNGWTGIFPLQRETNNGKNLPRTSEPVSAFTRTLQAAQRVWGINQGMDSEIRIEHTADA